jgi:GTP-binding protein Era
MNGASKIEVSGGEWVETKFNLITFIGKPNAGKSSLLNYLVGFPLSIVTHKVQTTRTTLQGISTIDNTQLVYMDTPGIFTASNNLEKAMVRAAWGSIAGAGYVALVVSAEWQLDQQTINILKHLKEHNKQVILIINKIDKTSGDRIKELHEEYSQYYNFSGVFNTKAKTGEGCDEITQFLKDNSPYGPWLYDSDDLTSAAERFLAEEITRKHLFLKLHQELPYNLTLETENWRVLDNGEIKINQVIYVARDAHKKIILGKKGRMLVKIGTLAREEINKTLGINSHLFLHIKVRPKWGSDSFLFKRLGLS